MLTKEPAPQQIGADYVPKEMLPEEKLGLDSWTVTVKTSGQGATLAFPSPEWSLLGKMCFPDLLAGTWLSRSGLESPNLLTQQWWWATLQA